MVTNFKKSFLLLITAIFFTQSLILGCSTEVDSEVKKMEEEEQDVITVVKKTHSVQGIPDSWATTDVYAYAYDDNGNKILIPVTVQNGVATFEADETYTKCVLVSLPKGTAVSAYTANPASILSADCQKSEIIDLTKDSLSFVLVKSDYIGTWNSLTDKLVINEEGTFSLDIGNDDSVDCAGTYVDTKTGVKVSYSEKVDGTDVSKNIEFTKQEADVLLGSVNEKETYFVKASTETPNLNGTWKNSDGSTTTIINNESEKIYVKVGETEIWGTIVQVGNMFVLQDEETNVIGTGFVSAAGNAYIYNEATGTYEIFTRNGSATESESTIPSKMFTVTYISEFADDVVQEKAEGTVLELQTPSHKGYRFDGWYTDEGKTAKAEATYTIAENLTFYAKWVQQGTVKFTSAQSEHADVTVDLGKEIDIPTPAKEKFDFDGWYDGETKVTGKYTVTKDVELVAKWTALYNVTFETAGGSPVESLQNVRAGTKITLPPTTLDGYDFEWWATEGKTFAIDEEYEVNSDVIFVAKWAGLCTVVYNTDGGSSVESVTVHDMETIHMPAAPTKDGYRFLGWYTTDENNLMQPDDVFNVTDSVTINAKWVAVYTYEYNDGIPADEDPNYQAPTADDGYVLTLKAAPVREGYVFKGWSDGEQTYQSGDEYTITADVVFEAVWNELYYYYYDRNDDVPTDLDISLLPKAENGTELEVGPAIERDGYVFAGWRVDKNIYQPGDSYTITKDTVFTAIWKVLVTYSSEFTEHEEELVDEGETIVLPSPSYDGYTFNHWTSNISEVWYSAESEVEISENVTFTAVWTKDPVAYSISGVPTNDTWQSGTVVAWVWDDDVATGFVVEPTFDKGTADYSFETAEDIKYCTIFVVDSMPSEPVTKDALVENATAKSADMDISSGNAVFETYKEVYTITNVASWWGSDNAQSFVKISSDTGESYLIEGVYDSENGIVTFATDYDFDTCVLLRFGSGVAPEDTDLSSYTNNELKNRSILLVMDENNTAVFAEEETKLADTNTVFFRDECSWRYHSPNGQNIEKGENVIAHFSSTADPSLTLEVPMTLHHESWLSATVDYTKYDTVYFSGRDSGGSVEKTESLSMDVLKIFYRVGSSGKNASGNYKLYSYTDTTQDDD